MMWVTPDGKVYLWPLWESHLDYDKLATNDTIKTKSPLNDANDWLRVKADRELTEAKTRY
jgi:hypothetical protein